MKLKLFTVLKFVIILILIVYIYIFNYLNIKKKSIKTKKISKLWKSSIDEWTNVDNKFFIRTNTAQYLKDENRILILMMNNIDHYFDYNFLFKIDLFYNKKIQIQDIYLFNITFNPFLRDNFYEDLELSVPFYLDSYLASNQDMSRVNILLNILIYDKNSSIMYGAFEPMSVEIKNWLPPNRTKDIYICTKDLYLEPSDYKNFEWWVEMNFRNEFSKIVIVNNSIPDTDEFRYLFTKYKGKLDVINYHKLPNLMNVSREVKYFKHMKDLIFGENREQIHKFGVEYMSFHECIYKYSDKADLILLIDPDEIFLPVKLEKFDNELVTYELIKSLNLTDGKSLDLFNKTYLQSNHCKKRVRFNLYNDNSYLRNFIDNVYTSHNIPTDYSIYFQSVAFIKKDLVDEIFSKLDETFLYFDKNNSQTPSYPIKVIFNRFIILIKRIFFIVNLFTLFEYMIVKISE